MLQPLVQRNARVLDTLGELDLAKHLPSLEGPEKVEEQRGKVLGKFVRHVGKRGICRDSLADALKGLDQRDSVVKERLLKRAHRLKDRDRVVSDHEARKEYAQIDVFRYNDPWSWRAMAKGGEQMDAVHARLGRSDHILLTYVAHHLIKWHPLDASRGGSC